MSNNFYLGFLSALVYLQHIGVIMYSSLVRIIKLWTEIYRIIKNIGMLHCVGLQYYKYFLSAVIFRFLL